MYNIIVLVIFKYYTNVFFLNLCFLPEKHIAALDFYTHNTKIQISHVDYAIYLVCIRYKIQISLTHLLISVQRTAKSTTDIRLKRLGNVLILL